MHRRLTALMAPAAVQNLLGAVVNSAGVFMLSGLQGEAAGRAIPA